MLPIKSKHSQVGLKAMTKKSILYLEPIVKPLPANLSHKLVGFEEKEKDCTGNTNQSNPRDSNTNGQEKSEFFSRGIVDWTVTLSTSSHILPSLGLPSQTPSHEKPPIDTNKNTHSNLTRKGFQTELASN